MTTIDIAPVRRVRLFKLGLVAYLFGAGLHGVAIAYSQGWPAGLNASAKWIMAAGAVLVAAHGIRWIMERE